MVEGQIEGAFVQGLGFALFEEMVWNGAQLINPTLMDYKIPTFMEAPAESECSRFQLQRFAVRRCSRLLRVPIKIS